MEEQEREDIIEKVLENLELSLLQFESNKLEECKDQKYKDEK